MRLISQKNSGPASARNHGISQAEGETVLFTDADCRPNPHWIEHMLFAFDSPDVAAVMGGYGTNQVELLAVFVQK